MKKLCAAGSKDFLAKKETTKTPGGQVLIFELFYGIDELLLEVK